LNTLPGILFSSRALKKARQVLNFWLQSKLTDAKNK
jgi:hypothetical protein